MTYIVIWWPRLLEMDYDPEPYAVVRIDLQGRWIWESRHADRKSAVKARSELRRLASTA